MPALSAGDEMRCMTHVHFVVAAHLNCGAEVRLATLLHCKYNFERAQLGATPLDSWP